MTRLTILPDNISFDLPARYAFFRLDKDHPSSIFFGCRDGSCGRCLVRIVTGEDAIMPAGVAEQALLASLKGRPGERLACRCLLRDEEETHGEITIETVGPDEAEV